jgi:hypothetical protein
MIDAIQSKRIVILGKNSKVWTLLKKSNFLAELPIFSIGHGDVGDFEFLPLDQIWVLSYSRVPSENYYLLKKLSNINNISVFYVSSASININSITQCYNYPKIKQQAQEDAVRLCNARIITIGWFYGAVTELPSGLTAATSVHQLAVAIRNIYNNLEQPVNLFRMVDRPFLTSFEKKLYVLYGQLIKRCGRFPCLLRPIDFVLRLVGIRWYGYLYLSNKLWSMTI